MSTVKAAKPKHITHPVLGKLPAGWKAVRLGDIGDLRFSGVDKKTEEGEAPVLLCNYMDVYNNRRITQGMDFMRATATPSEIERFTLRQGDVLFTKDSEKADDMANAAVVMKDMEGVLCGYHLALVRPDPMKCDSEYLMLQFLNPLVRHQFTKRANGITRFSMTLDTAAGIVIPLPPLTEQRRIARILGTWDRAIALLGQQIAAKEERLRGLIDQLVSGQRAVRRAKDGKLPKGWRWVKLGELGTFSKGKGVLKTDIDVEGVPVVTYGELYTVHHVRIKRFHSFVNEAVAERSQPIQCNDVLFAGSGETAAEIGKAAVYLGNARACAGGDVIILRTKGINALYLATALNSSIADRQRLKLGQGHSVVHIYPSQLSSLKVPVPPEEVQDFIASATTALDDELDLLRSKQAQLQEQKRGLMQWLLGGGDVQQTMKP